MEKVSKVKDRLVMTGKGKLIDYGPQSKIVLEWILWHKWVGFAYPALFFEKCAADSFLIFLFMKSAGCTAKKCSQNQFLLL